MMVNKNFAAGLFALLAMWMAHSAWAQVQTWPQTTALTVGEVAAFPSDPIVELPVTFINNDPTRQIATIQFDLISPSPNLGLPQPAFEPTVVNGRLVSFEYGPDPKGGSTGRYRTVVAPLPANDTMNSGTIIRFTLHEPISAYSVTEFFPILVENALGSDAQGNRIVPALIRNGGIFDARSMTKDSDGDGMPDTWEMLHGLNRNDPTDAGLDLDLDGLTNVEEYRAGSHIDNKDSDFDGVPDGADGLELAWLQSTRSDDQYAGLATGSLDGGVYYVYRDRFSESTRWPAIARRSKDRTGLWRTA